MGQIVIVDEQKNRFAILSYDVIAGKLNEPITMGNTMHEYLMKLIDDLDLKWQNMSELRATMSGSNEIPTLNVMFKPKSKEK
jgi:hypothetical protein